VPNLQLGKPGSEDEIYLARGDEVEPFRPIIQGDIFRDVTIPSLEATHDLAMVIAHPCNMRAGAVLRPRVQMVPVLRHEPLTFDEWPEGHFRFFPLPNLLLDNKHYAARLDETGMVESAMLTCGRRVACLENTGLLLLQQRYIHSLTRAVVQLATLDAASAHILAEVELQEDWQATLARLRIERGESAADALGAESAAFDEFLGVIENGGSSLRDQLQDRFRRSDVRRRIRQEIARRRE